MSEWCWNNGEIVPLEQARISIEDRGFLFADGVYETVRLYSGRPLALREHLERLVRSCGGIHLNLPISVEQFSRELHRLIARASIDEGFCYIQVTRGGGPRNHLFPTSDVKPTMLAFVRELPSMLNPEARPGISLHTVMDDRWNRCWIKSIALLPNVLARNEAAQAGADEAVFQLGGSITECSSSNIFLVIDGALHTHSPGAKVLAGITREHVIRCARELGIAVHERALSLVEAKRAQEVFITSTLREIAWVSLWDREAAGAASCGAVTLKLAHALSDHIRGSCSGS